MARAKNPLLILHGWSDTSTSFLPLASFLEAHGFQAGNLYLSDYLSMADEVSIEDAARAMESALRQKLAAGELALPFDLIVHSTGALVARTWLAGHYRGATPAAMPVQRLLMLAPANFGSRLATLGQTILGRIAKGWEHGFHTGKLMLDGLELGSPFQWGLAARDLFALDTGASATVYGEDLVWPFVLVGSMPYQSGLRQMANESGSDGTVRVAAANLNAYGATLDFTATDAALAMAASNNAAALAQAAPLPWKHRHGEDFEFPLAVLRHRDHASITDPNLLGEQESAQEQQEFQGLLLRALSCPSFAEYRAIGDDWRTYSDRVQDPALADDDHHLHLQLNVFVVDEYQQPVSDYMIEFIAPNYAQNSDLTGVFHDKVIRDVHKCEQDPALRTIYIDRQRMFELFYGGIADGQPKQLRLSISASAPGPQVSYFVDAFGAKGEFIVHSDQEADRWLRRNATHFLKLVIPRLPSAEVFKLKQAP